MFNKTVINAVSSLTPFISSNILDLFGVPNQFGIILNLILNGVVDKYALFITDKIIFTGVAIIFAFLILFKLQIFNIFTFFGKTHMNSIKIIGYHDDNVIDSRDNDVFNYINKYLIENFTSTNIAKIGKCEYIDVPVLEIATGLFLSTNITYNVGRVKSSRQNGDEDANSVQHLTQITATIEYTIYSKYIDVRKFINDIVETMPKYTNHLMLVGNEGNAINYPYDMICVIHSIIEKYKCKHIRLIPDEKKDRIGWNWNKKEKSDEKSNVETLQSNLKSAYTLEYNINNYFITELISIKTFKLHNVFSIKLSSIGIDLSKFVEECKQEYELSQNNCKKYRIVIKNSKVTNAETEDNFSSLSSLSLIDTNYPNIDPFIALNHFIINKHSIYNYLLCKSGMIAKNFKNLIVGEFKISLTTDDEFYENSRRGLDNDRSMIIESDTTNPSTFIENARKMYDEYLQKHNGKIIYHFKYAGKNKFVKTILHDFSETDGQKCEIFESFDTIFSEHSQFLRNDINSLNNVDYYKQRGMRLKKSYLFHGIGGTGKTSSAIAMAIETRRHIIEYPLCLFETVEEFEEATNVKIIDEVKFDNSNIIMVFDEIDIYTKNFTSRDEPIANEEKQTIINVVTNKEDSNDTKPETKKAKLNLSTILSKFDGIGNYNKLIIVATANNIKGMDDALLRDLRLTKLHYDKMRIVDCVGLIENFRKITLTDAQKALILDRFIVPSTLVYLCDKYHSNTIDELLAIAFKQN